MQILYGVVGEGMGHAMRSSVILDHLVAQGHDVQIMASGRATDFLKQRFSDVSRIHGFHMILEENRVRMGKTLWSNVLAGLEGVPRNIAAYFELLRDFRPEVVISDFESWTYLYGRMHSLPLLSIDNMQVINRCVHPPEIIAGAESEFQLTKAFVKAKLPFCDAYYITSFFEAPIRKERTQLFPPILRRPILEASPRTGEHLLVYQTAEGYEHLAERLGKTGIECRVYGMRRGLTEEQVEGSLRYRPFSERTFIEDLATARAVVAAAGFTLMGECVYLKKPLLALPIAGQFEQLLNARYLAYLGYGAAAEALDARALDAFLARTPEYAAALAGHSQEGNRLILDAVDAFLADPGAAGR